MAGGLVGMLHAFEDDNQLYLIRCIDAISCWMSANRLRLNTDKTELIWTGSNKHECLPGRGLPVTLECDTIIHQRLQRRTCPRRSHHSRSVAGAAHRRCLRKMLLLAQTITPSSTHAWWRLHRHTRACFRHESYWLLYQPPCWCTKDVDWQATADDDVLQTVCAVWSTSSSSAVIGAVVNSTYLVTV